MKTITALAALIGLSAMPIPLMAQAQAPAISAETQVNALEALFGVHDGFRRSHAKGICASGNFVGNTVGRTLTSASAFSGDKIPVVARFSVGGGNPKASDKGKSARGLALQFTLPKGERWLMSNLSAPVFFVSKPEQFEGFLTARVPDPATGKPDPVKLRAFNDANAETLLQAAYFASNPVPASYAAVNYWGVHAFEFISAQGQSQFVRWQFVPEKGTLGLTDDEVKSLPTDFLAGELGNRLAQAPVVFDFKLQLAEKGDTLTDPTKVWPENRLVLPAGKLVIDKTQPSAACDAITFIPLVLPNGIKPSADPVLRARSASYVTSLTRSHRAAPPAAKQP